jgi:hypothetical protein
MESSFALVSIISVVESCEKEFWHDSEALAFYPKVLALISGDNGKKRSRMACLCLSREIREGLTNPVHVRSVPEVAL